jgi:hypothetical protein
LPSFETRPAGAPQDEVFPNVGVSSSKIRLGGDRDVVVEQMLVVLGANFFGHRLLNATEALDG